jgi:hypothetical protein
VVEAVTFVLAARGIERGDAAELGEGGFVLESLGVVAGGDQEGGGHVGAHAVDGIELGSSLGDEDLEQPVDLLEQAVPGSR